MKYFTIMYLSFFGVKALNKNLATGINRTLMPFLRHIGRFLLLHYAEKPYTEINWMRLMANGTDCNAKKRPTEFLNGKRWQSNLNCHWY